MDHGIHRGPAIAFVVTHLRTEADLRNPMELPQGASSVAFENLIYGYDEAIDGIAGAVSLEELMR